MPQSQMKFAVTGPQYNQRLLSYTSVSGALTLGKFDGTIASGGTGIYVITFKEPFLRVPECVVTCTTDNRFARISAITALAVTIETQDIVGGAAAASDFVAFVSGSNSADAIL